MALDKKILQKLCEIEQNTTPATGSGPGPGPTTPPVNNESDSEWNVVCLTQGGVSRSVHQLKYVDTSGVLQTRYYTITGEEITTATADTVAEGDCRSHCATCRQ